MKIEIGLWIDYRKAVLVYLAGKDEKMMQIDSALDKQDYPSGVSRSLTPYGAQDMLAEDRRERQYRHHVRNYYDEVVAQLHDGASIFIFGPGRAKNELSKYIESRNLLPGRAIAVETADSMTDKQIAARVRQYFAEQKRPAQRR